MRANQQASFFLMCLIFGSFSLMASDVNIDPQREDTNLQQEQTRGLQFNEDKTLQQEQTRGRQFTEDANLQQERTNDLQFYEDQDLRQEKHLER